VNTGSIPMRNWASTVGTIGTISIGRWFQNPELLPQGISDDLLMRLATWCSARQDGANGDPVIAIARRKADSLAGVSKLSYGDLRGAT
jgi:hypothetical protein